MTQIIKQLLRELENARTGARLLRETETEFRIGRAITALTSDPYTECIQTETLEGEDMNNENDG